MDSSSPSPTHIQVDLDLPSIRGFTPSPEFEDRLEGNESPQISSNATVINSPMMNGHGHSGHHGGGGPPPVSEESTAPEDLEAGPNFLALGRRSHSRDISFALPPSAHRTSGGATAGNANGTANAPGRSSEDYPRPASPVNSVEAFAGPRRSTANVAMLTPPSRDMLDRDAAHAHGHGHGHGHSRERGRASTLDSTHSDQIDDALNRTMSHATRRLSLSHVEGASAGAPGGASAGPTGTPEDAADSVSRRHHHHHQDLPLEKRITEESLYPGASDLRELRQEAIDRRGSANAGSNVVGTRGVDSIAPVVENKGDVVIGAGGVADFVDFSQLEDFVETRRQRHHARRVCTNNGGNGGVADSMYSGSNMDSRAELLKAGAGTDVDEKSDYDDEELSSVSPTEEKARINKGFDHDSPPLHARHVPVPEDARFTFFSSEAQTTIHSTGIAGLVRPGESFRDLFARGGGGVWWLDVMDPDREELNAIARAFAIHPLTAEDILTQENREKVELFKNYYFVCFRTFSQMRDDEGKEFLDPINIYMVVFRGGILTFSFAASSSSSANANAEARGEEGAQATTTRRLHHPHARNVRRRIGRLRDSLSLSSDWVCYAMIDDIVDSFGPVMRDIETETETIEDQVFIARVEDFAAFLSQIGNLRKKVMGMMRLLGGKADVIKGFAKRCNEEYNVTPHGDIGLYLGDIQDHVITMMTNLSHLEKMLSRSYGNYLASLSVKNIMLGNHVNKALTKITVLATILVPLNMISSLFGMNVKVPGQDADNLGWFFGIVGLILFIVVLTILISRRFRLFE